MDIKKTIKIVFATCAMTLCSMSSHAEGEFQSNGLMKIDVPSALCTGWFRQSSWNCKPITLNGYIAEPQGQNKKGIVIVSHGSEGMSILQRWHIEHLAKHGYYGIAINHWQPRGIGRDDAQHRYTSASLDQGGNAMNVAIDVMAVAKWVRDDPRFSGYKIGHLGESMGAAVGRELNRDGFISNLVSSALGHSGQPLDAYVGLYLGCSQRSTRDSFLNKPVLVINGSLDDETTLEQCQKWMPWFNSRGGNGELLAIPNEYHHFDSWYPLQHFARPQNPRECANLIDPDKGTITDDKTGKSYPTTNDGFAQHRKACMINGVTAGSRNQKPGNAFEIWTAFFDKHLISQQSSNLNTKPNSENTLHDQRTAEVLREMMPENKKNETNKNIDQQNGNFELNGSWQGTMSCAEHIGSMKINNPGPWTEPVSLTIIGKNAQWLRSGRDYSEVLSGAIFERYLTLTGEGGYNNSPTKQWRTSVNLQVDGNSRNLDGVATIHTMNGEVSRRCKVKVVK